MSATPHIDNAAATIARARAFYADRLKDQGPAGVVTRVSLAIQASTVEAEAVERERGVSDAQIRIAVAKAMGDVAATRVAQLMIANHVTDLDVAIKALTAMMQTAVYQATSTLRENLTGKAITHKYPNPPTPGRA